MENKIKQATLWLILLISVTSCGSVITRSKPINTSVDGLEKVELDNVSYEVALESVLMTDLYFSNVDVYEGWGKPVNEACDANQRVFGCASGGQNVIVVTKMHGCMLAMHEFLHVGLYQAHGDGDADHNHSHFEESKLLELCEEYVENS